MNIPTPQEQRARAEALRAKFFPKTPPIVHRQAHPQPREVEIIRTTYDQCRKVKAVVCAGRVYGPLKLDDRFSRCAEIEFDEATRAVRNGPSAKRIVVEIAKNHGLPVATILGPTTMANIVAARHEAMAEVYVRCPGMSLPDIGRLFNRDHTTILHAIRKLGVWRGGEKS
jgi:hypothetical protein